MSKLHSHEHAISPRGRVGERAVSWHQNSDVEYIAGSANGGGEKVAGVRQSATTNKRSTEEPSIVRTVYATVKPEIMKNIYINSTTVR